MACMCKTATHRQKPWQQHAHCRCAEQGSCVVAQAPRVLKTPGHDFVCESMWTGI